jgi:hypothetical protein
MPRSGHGQVCIVGPPSGRPVTTREILPGAERFIVYRATGIAGTAVQEGYLVPGVVGRLTAEAFDAWLAKRGLTEAERQSMAVLVIRERLAADGSIAECELEHRRGAVDGPYHGSPARIVFTGPARQARFYQAAPECALPECALVAGVPLGGALTEVAAMPGVAVRPAPVSDPMAAIRAAIRGSYGEAARIIDTREPTVIEAMAGIATVLHVVRADGHIVGCGILWHGPCAITLQADFPRFDVAPSLSAHQTAVLDRLAAAEALAVCETRQDEHGLAIVARRLATADFVQVRLDGETARMVPYAPGRPAGLTADQAGWLHYVETYEALQVIDAYRDGATDALIVLTGGADGTAWRHRVDIDGIETWRRPGITGAAATLHGSRGDGVPAEPACAPAPAADGVGLAGCGPGTGIRLNTAAYHADNIADQQPSRVHKAPRSIQ